MFSKNKKYIIKNACVNYKTKIDLTLNLFLFNFSNFIKTKTKFSFTTSTVLYNKVAMCYSDGYI